MVENGSGSEVQKFPKGVGPLGKGHLILKKSCFMLFEVYCWWLKTSWGTGGCPPTIYSVFFHPTGGCLPDFWINCRIYKAVQTRGWQHCHHLLPTFEGAPEGKELEGWDAVVWDAWRDPPRNGKWLVSMGSFSPLNLPNGRTSWLVDGGFYLLTSVLGWSSKWGSSSEKPAAQVTRFNHVCRVNASERYPSPKRVGLNAR